MIYFSILVQNELVGRCNTKQVKQNFTSKNVRGFFTRSFYLKARNEAAEEIIVEWAAIFNKLNRMCERTNCINRERIKFSLLTASD